MVSVLKVGIIGKGKVGSALGTGLKRAGHDVLFGHRDPNESVLKAAEWGEVVILAVPFVAVKNVAQEIALTVKGKVVVDVTNVFDANDEWALGFSTSGAEELQKVLLDARVVKAFNTVFAQNQSIGKVGTERLSAFIAGDDAEAKNKVMKLAQDIGFEPVDCGPLRNARYLEPMAMLIIDLAFDLRMGTKIGYKLVKA